VERAKIPFGLGKLSSLAETRASNGYSNEWRGKATPVFLVIIETRK